MHVSVLSGAQPARRAANGAGVAAILLWASLALMTATAQGLPPFQLLAASFGVAFALSAVLLTARRAWGRLRAPAGAWLLAVGGIFGYHALYFYALGNAPVAEASLIAYLWPLLIVLFALRGAGGARRWRALAGAALGFAGTALLVWQRAGGPPGADAGADGYLAALGCAFVWSGYSALNRRYADVPSDMIGGVCGVVALAGGLCHLAFEQTVAPSVAQWWAILGLGIGPVGLAFFAWDYATKRGSLPLLGALSYLAPLVSTLLLIATGAAAAGWGPVLAALAIIGGAWLATRC